VVGRRFIFSALFASAVLRFFVFLTFLLFLIGFLFLGLSLLIASQLFLLLFTFIHIFRGLIIGLEDEDIVRWNFTHFVSFSVEFLHLPQELIDEILVYFLALD
jgi:hypothetical protein